MRGILDGDTSVFIATDSDGDEREIDDERKTCCAGERARRPALERRPDGSVRIGGFKLASQLLRGGNIRQAGFNAELVARLPQENVSVLFEEGESHRKQRAAVARFFAPTVVTGRYRGLMTDLSLRLVERLKADRRAALDDLSLDLSVAVAGEIVGLTDSLRPGLGKRLNRFFALECTDDASLWRKAAYIVETQVNLLRVYLLDVRPAIQARKRARREDLISHLLDNKWSNLDILTECVTYGTAGMSTTREFIVVAAWHLLERHDLRTRFLDGDENTRCTILDEILRLEPAVGTLYRRTTGPIMLDDEGRTEHLPADTLVAIDVRGVNSDQTTAGTCPYRLDPDRCTRGPARHMSFGDGPHKCPGATVAIQETSIFLNHLLRVSGLRMASKPTLGWNAMTMGYVLRDAVLVVD